MTQRIIFLLIIVGFVSIRLINILGLPLYLDEGLYIFWAKLFTDSSGYAYVSLQDGKTPLFIWLISWINPMFNNYLLTARVISVLSGLVTALSWMILVSRVFSKKTSIWFGVIIACLPYAVLIERMAFVDSLLVMFGSLALLFFYLCFESITKKLNQILILTFAVLSGISLGAGFLTKTTAIVFLVAQIIIALYWIFFQLRSKRLMTSAKMLITVVILIITYFEIIGYLKVGAHKYWGEIAIKERQLTFSVSEVAARIYNIYQPDAYNHYLRNLYVDLKYFFVYFGFVLVMFFYGIWSIRKDKVKLWFLIYGTALFLAVLLFGKVTASRYFYICVPVMVAISALGAQELYKRKRIIVLVLLALTALQSLMLVLSPTKALYTADDRSYFVNSNLSALGLLESIEYIKPHATESIVGVSGIWGVLEGSQVMMEQFGIENVNIDHWLEKTALNNTGGCNLEWKKIEQNCFKLNINKVLYSEKKHKYLYLTRGDTVEVLRELYPINMEKIFKRNGGNLSVYLIRLNE